MQRSLASAGVALSLAIAPSAHAQSSSEASLRERLEAAIAQLDRQQQQLDNQARELVELRQRLDEQESAASLPPPPSSASPALPPLERVGQAPEDADRPPEIAVLRSEGSVVTHRGQLTGEAQYDYARSDRSRAVFRGVELLEAVLIGVFDINESRQDVLTVGTVGRLGLTSRLEINGRLPFVYRSDKSVLAPVANPSQPNAGQLDRPVSGANIGDIDFGLRYQITDGRDGAPYLIAGVQAVAPTGTDPFKVPRDALGNALKGATGAGFWGVTPNLTAILPTDPAVLFATLGYTYNFARDINRQIGAAYIERVAPGNQPSASAGIAIALNPRTSISFGYAQTWALGTKTRVRALNQTTQALGEAMTAESRDLQIGRLLFGVSYRTSPSTTLNWNVEVGATDDAADVRTTLRIPFTFTAY